MYKTYDENRITQVPSVTNLAGLKSFLDSLQNGHYCMSMNGSNTEAVGLPRSASIMHVDTITNFSQVELTPYNTPGTTYRLYKVNGTWNSTWTEV